MEKRDLKKIKNLIDYIAEMIELCPRCKGEGTIESSELEDYHHRTYKYTTENCSMCEGSGRVIIQKLRIKGCIPYKQEKLS